MCMVLVYTYGIMHACMCHKTYVLLACLCSVLAHVRAACLRMCLLCGCACVCCVVMYVCAVCVCCVVVHVFAV